jgi:two-component system response regulator
MFEAAADVDVLLVEDSEEDAELTIRTLRKHNLAAKLKWVRDGAEALNFLSGTGIYSGRDTRFAPAIVLLDLRLPKVDGLEVLEKMRANVRTRRIPVVVLTSSTEQSDISRTYALGGNSFVSKPVESEEFVSAVTQLGLYWLLVNRAPVVE